ncbi:enoyl-CoA hydratase [Desulfofundulus thermobenzoicus]|uniref:Enoyl-CoA hydratase n=1 Tax=Desulfofundulus thermobenzoicus TaxID=29376 RepID=A0A6N7IUW5_9FIRM|nr:MaoC family dehydratase [Desulfofundulus thermobenzoicus]MQL52918.1 enoyl-CoA hydratase [Desulfofundulus thermobenzoicus]HHW44604.1 MaoC family dehydratase [Desulfotomaculum sp.]
MRFFSSWSEMQVGDSITFYRTFTEGDVSTFLGVTGDFNPIHMDPRTAALCGFQGRVVPGLLTGSMITHAGGTLLPEPYPATRMSFRFLAPVYIGETICATVTVTEKDPQKNKLTLHMVCTNQAGKVVLEGEVSGRIMPVSRRREKPGA